MKGARIVHDDDRGSLAVSFYYNELLTLTTPTGGPDCSLTTNNNCNVINFFGH